MTWIWPVLAGLVASSAALLGSAVILVSGERARHAAFWLLVPQEIGDFAILLGAGIPRRRAILLNYLAAVTVIPGALIAFIWASSTAGVIPWLLPVAAGGFVYIAVANLVPALHHRRGAMPGVLQMAIIGLGVGTVWLLGHHHP